MICYNIFAKRQKTTWSHIFNTVEVISRRKIPSLEAFCVLRRTMNIYVNQEISLLMETADLLYAYVNQLPLEGFAAEDCGGLCAEELEQIMMDVCGDLDRNHEDLQFFFQGFTLSAYPEMERAAFPAGLLLYPGLRIGFGNLAQARAALHDSGFGGETPYRILGVDPFHIHTEPCEEARSIFSELGNHKLPQQLHERLTEILTDYHRHVDRLCDLLEPLALHLHDLLAPWQELLAPKLERCQMMLQTRQGQESFLQSIMAATFQNETIELQSMFFTPRLIRANHRLCRFSKDRTELYCIGGVDAILGEGRELKEKPDAAAVRALSNMERVDILRAMAGRIVTPKELTKELGMNPGSVFRELNKLTEAHLVKMVVSGVHRRYTTNLEAVDLLLQQLHEYIHNSKS